MATRYTFRAPARSNQCRLKHRGSSHGNNADVVFLTEGLGGTGDRSGGRGSAQQFVNALEAK